MPSLTIESGPIMPSATTDNPGGFGHIPSLDGIRGLAILLVLVDHLMGANNETGSRLLNLAAQIRGATYCGVNLFFALSGFLITGILLDTLSVPHYFKTFYARRALRIFPLYYGTLIVLMALTGPLHFVWSGLRIYYLTYTSNLALWYVPGGGLLNLGVFNINHFWSLQVEEQFYLIWPLIIYRVRRLDTLLRIALITCAVILGIRIFLVLMRGHPHFTNPYLVYSPTFACADNILFGCALCILLRTRWRTAALRLAPRVLVCSGAVLLTAAILNGGMDFTVSRFIPTVGFTLIGISCAAIIAMTLRAGSKTQAFFSDSRLRFFGKYSYGIYVFHYSISGALTQQLRAFLNAHFHSKGLSVVLAAFAVGILSVLIAVASYQLYEAPFLRLKRFFSYNRAAPSS